MQDERMKQPRHDLISTASKLIAAVALIFGCASVAFASAPAPLTTLQAVHALTNVEANEGIPVAFEATVTYYRGYENTLFVQDGDIGVYVFAPINLQLTPGDRVLVRGTTQKSFNPIVIAKSVTLLRHGALSTPYPASFDEMIRTETDCKLVTVRAVVRSADILLSAMAPVHFIRLQLLMDGGYFDVNVDADDAGAPEGLLDAEVQLTGVASEQFDSKMHETGILLHVQSLSDVKIIERAKSSPWTLPITPMDRVITVYHLRDSTQRVRVSGTITYYQPGSAVVLQDGSRSIWISTDTHNPLRIGDAADATGFPDVHDGFLYLTHGEIHDSQKPAPITPLPATWDTHTPTGFDLRGHHNDLVSIEGKVVTKVREASQDEYVLDVGNNQFSAIYRHPGDPVAVTRDIPLGSWVRVTGICVLEDSNPFMAQVPFDILLRSNDDIELVQNPSLLNVRNLTLAVGLLFAIAVFAGARGWILERKVRHKSAALTASIEAEAAQQRRAALLEQRRSRILEHINGERPLGETLEEIAAMVSFMLEGARCWCEAADGACLGDYPQKLLGLRIVKVNIDARSGPALGAFYAGVDAATPASATEIEALEKGSQLATLAIETRRLYSDLRHRSEFDLLTDIPNRFAIENFIDAQIEEARKSGGILGLIYIDLDRFKPINDRYGHHMGDLYLQEVALRMSRQLLGGDMLARLGGDEFAALVRLPHGRTDLDTIIARLERSFEEPLVLDGQFFHSSASIGAALYPADGVTRDDLLCAADTAMYAVKNIKHQLEKSVA
jgi:diguanylate cyclase (GGDEF)-like protein